jgi:Ni/Fe-hydrogenase subunit HybB-like protein
MSERARPEALPRRLVSLCGALVAVGVVAFVAGLMTDPATAWSAFHVNFLYFGGLSLGGLVLACALVIVGARWAGPVRHVAASLAAWVPVTLLLAVFAILGREHIFSGWIHGAPHGKEGWLNPVRVYATDLTILAILTLLALAFLRASFRPALHGVAETAGRARGLFERWTRNWKGEEVERQESERRLRVLAPVICLTYAFGFTIVGFDQVMSLTPTWFSNIFGWYFIWGGFLSGVAATALVSVLLRRSAAWQREITRDRMHDLGKMVFAFSIFWMYLFFAQYLVIWYGNLPEETQFFQLRLGSQFLQDTWTWSWTRLDEPYVKLSLAAWIGCWIVPFWMLLGQEPKKTPVILGGVSAVVLLGFWLERNALVWPSLRPGDGDAWLGPIQLGIALGFLGAFVLVYLTFIRIFPTLPLPKHD